VLGIPEFRGSSTVAQLLYSAYLSDF